MGYTVWPDGITGEVIEEVYKERQRQDKLRDEGKFAWTCASLDQSNDRKLSVLAEEFGEVAREVVEETISADKGHRPDSQIIRSLRAQLRKELIQVAAVCVAWAESL